MCMYCIVFSLLYSHLYSQTSIHMRLDCKHIMHVILLLLVFVDPLCIHSNSSTIYICICNQSNTKMYSIYLYLLRLCIYFSENCIYFCSIYKAIDRKCQDNYLRFHTLRGSFLSSSWNVTKDVLGMCSRYTFFVKSQHS